MTSHIQAQDLTIVLPTRNEAQSISKVIDEIRALPVRCNILVMDGLSTDGTDKIALNKGVKVLYESRKGKGVAFRSSLEFVETPYVVMVNADYTYPLEYTQTIYGLLKMGKYDVVIGCRELKEEGSMSAANTLGNFLLSTLASILYGHRIYDVCSGMWGFRLGILKKFNLTSMGFTLEADLFSNAIRNKCRICQIPIGYRPRLEGSKAKLKMLDGFKIAWFLIKRRFR